MKQNKFQLVKGFRDFYPEEMAARKWLFALMAQVSQKFGYQEYEGPALEDFNLYAAKSGEELVKKQTFTLKDRGGKKLALRPEMTPSLARMISQKQGELTMPLRLFTIGRRWRYETPQKGRTREFYQWDVDLIGVDSSEADAEVIAIAAEFLKSVGLKPNQVIIKVNDRCFLEKKLKMIKIDQDKTSDVFRAIDKKDKMKADEWRAYLAEIGLSESQIQGLKKILQETDFSGKSEEITNLFSTLKDLGVEEYVEFDPTIVRGLDYYTDIVFEARDRDNQFRALLGGGRYDNLIEIVGGEKVSAVGFACGDKVIEEVLRKFNLWPKLSGSPAKVLVTIFDESTYRDSISLTKKLREAGISTELYLEPIRLDRQLKYADRKKIPFVAILGPKEIKEKTVTLKNLKTTKQETISQTKAIQKLASQDE